MQGTHMLSERFLARLEGEFPQFYERVNNESMHEAARYRAEAGGDVQKALLRARFDAAGRLWLPYVRGTIPFVGDERPAMEAFSRLVLTVDHLVGYVPPSMEAARVQVVEVLRNSVDYERLHRVLDRQEKEKAKAAAGATAATAGLMATVTTLMAPIQMYRSARSAVGFVPPQLRIALGAVVVAALLSVPFVAGYSAGMQAEKAARNYGEVPTRAPSDAVGGNGAGQQPPLGRSARPV